jgi:uncharacterized protein (TIGR02246 family)
LGSGFRKEIPMTRRLGIGAVVVVAVAAILVAQQTPRPAPSEATRAELQAVVEAYSKALAQKDLEGCMAAYGGADAVMLGTGPGERWLGDEEIRTAHREFFKTFDTETSKATWKVGFVNGDVAWGARMSMVTDYLKNVKKEFALNMSFVLEKRDGKWKIVLLHFSNLTGREE